MECPKQVFEKKELHTVIFFMPIYKLYVEAFFENPKKIKGSIYIIPNE